MQSLNLECISNSIEKAHIDSHPSVYVECPSGDINSQFVAAFAIADV